MATTHSLDSYIAASILVRIISDTLDLSGNERSFGICGNKPKKEHSVAVLQGQAANQSNTMS